MINVCPACGQYEVAKTIFPAENRVVCPHCQTSIPFQFQPLFCVTGASTAGKTTTALALQQMQTDRPVDEVAAGVLAWAKGLS